jgi:hypothetical protein
VGRDRDGSWSCEDDLMVLQSLGNLYLRPKFTLLLTTTEGQKNSEILLALGKGIYFRNKNLPKALLANTIFGNKTDILDSFLGDRMSLLQLFNFALSARRTLYIICRK